jgi:hypothetical protein
MVAFFPMNKTNNPSNDSQNLLTSRSQKRSRKNRVRKPPPKLELLIELVNLLPPENTSELEALSPETLKAQAEAIVNDPSYKVSKRWLLINAGLKNKGYSPIIWELTKLLVEHLENISPELRDYVYRGRLTEYNVLATTTIPNESAIIRYEDLWYSAQRLRKIVSLNNAKTRGSFLVSMLYPAPVPIPIWDRIDEFGYIRVFRDSFTDAVGETDVEAARIRECKACKRIFWAGRLDAQQCGSAKCKSILSTRLWRENKQLYNKERRRKKRKARGRASSEVKV